MHYHSQLKHLHLHIPKTGGTSLGISLEPHGYNSDENSNEILKDHSPHSGLSEIENNPQSYSFFKDYYKTITLRNPWDWAVSYYIAQFTKPNMIQNYGPNYSDVMSDIDPHQLSFNFCMKKEYKTITPQRYLISSKLKFDDYFNFNNYSEIAKKLESKFKFTLKSIPHINSRFDGTIDTRFVNLNKHCQDYYDDETYETVKKHSLKIIDIFDYKIS